MELWNFSHSHRYFVREHSQGLMYVIANGELVVEKKSTQADSREWFFTDMAKIRERENDH